MNMLKKTIFSFCILLTFQICFAEDIDKEIEQLEKKFEEDVDQVDEKVALNIELAKERCKRNQKEQEEARKRAQREAEFYKFPFTHLERRWNKPATKEEYIEKLREAKAKGDKAAVARILADGYKKGWCDRHPFKCDCIRMVSALGMCAGAYCLLSILQSAL